MRYVGLSVGLELQFSFAECPKNAISKHGKSFGSSGKEPGWYSDGDGLLPQVRPNGAKSWLARIQTNGKRRDFGLGDAHQITLSEAREALVGLHKQACEGVDPLAARRKQRAVMPSFKDAVYQAHGELLNGWKNGKHRSMDHHDGKPCVPVVWPMPS